MITTDPSAVDLDELDLTDLSRFEHGFPHELFTALRRDRPVWWHEPTEHTPEGEGFWVLTRYADIHAAAADAATFSSDRGGVRSGGGTLLEDLPGEVAAGALFNMMDDPRHQRIRQLVTPTVSPKALRRLESEFRQRTVAIIDDLADRGECDFLVDIAAELPLQALAQLMGIPQEDRHDLFGWANATLDYRDRDLGEWNERVQEAGSAMHEYGVHILREKRECPADDILSAVANAEIEGPDGEPGPLTELEQVMFFTLLIMAGSETTRNSIAVGLLALIDRPDQLAALRDDRSVMPTAVEEILRWATSASYNRRTVSTAVEVDGHRMQPGEKVTLWWSSANRDENVFEDPFRFDICRDPNPHLAFGHGSHFCLGANLARLEISLVFGELLDRLEGFEPAGEVEWTRSNKHTGVRHMPIRFRRRR